MKIEIKAICVVCKEKIDEGNPFCYECMKCDKCSPECFEEQTLGDKK